MATLFDMTKDVIEYGNYGSFKNKELKAVLRYFLDDNQGFTVKVKGKDIKFADALDKASLNYTNNKDHALKRVSEALSLYVFGNNLKVNVDAIRDDLAQLMKDVDTGAVKAPAKKPKSNITKDFSRNIDELIEKPNTILKFSDNKLLGELRLYLDKDMAKTLTIKGRTDSFENFWNRTFDAYKNGNTTPLNDLAKALAASLPGKKKAVNIYNDLEKLANVAKNGLTKVDSSSVNEKSGTIHKTKNIHLDKIKKRNLLLAEPKMGFWEKTLNRPWRIGLAVGVVAAVGIGAAIAFGPAGAAYGLSAFSKFALSFAGVVPGAVLGGAAYGLGRLGLSKVNKNVRRSMLKDKFERGLKACQNRKALANTLDKMHEYVDKQAKIADIEYNNLKTLAPNRHIQKTIAQAKHAVLKSLEGGLKKVSDMGQQAFKNKIYKTMQIKHKLDKEDTPAFKNIQAKIKKAQDEIALQQKNKASLLKSKIKDPKREALYDKKIKEQEAKIAKYNEQFTHSKFGNVDDMTSEEYGQHLRLAGIKVADYEHQKYGDKGFADLLENLSKEERAELAVISNKNAKKQSGFLSAFTKKKEKESAQTKLDASLAYKDLVDRLADKRNKRKTHDSVEDEDVNVM